MLQLRPTCEHCQCALPPESVSARICSYECTFCATCVEEVLSDVCPNCGGGFERRPVRPANNLVAGNFLGNDPASSKLVHKPVEAKTHQQLVQRVKVIPPSKR